MVAADARTSIGLSLPPGQAGDAQEGRNLLSRLPMPAQYPVMDRVYEGDETRQCVVALGLTPMLLPKSNRINPWEYDWETYKKCNEVDGSFAGSRDSGESSPATTSWTGCSLSSSTSLSS